MKNTQIWPGGWILVLYFQTIPDAKVRRLATSEHRRIPTKGSVDKRYFFRFCSFGAQSFYFSFPFREATTRNPRRVGPGRLGSKQSGGAYIWIGSRILKSETDARRISQLILRFSKTL